MVYYYLEDYSRISSSMATDQSELDFSIINIITSIKEAISNSVFSQPTTTSQQIKTYTKRNINYSSSNNTNTNTNTNTSTTSNTNTINQNNTKSVTKISSTSASATWHAPVFKATIIIEKKEKDGKESIMLNIRNCLNKLTSKNYVTQMEEINRLFDYYIDNTNEDQRENNNSDNDNENHEKSAKGAPSVPSVPYDEEKIEFIKKVAQMVFDIASTNKFYSEMYAMCYNELMKKYPIFKTIYEEFLVKYNENLLVLKYVDAKVDYDAFCKYNKQNDHRKATAHFIIHGFRLNVISSVRIIDIINQLFTMLFKYIDEDNKLNEVEEITEIINILLIEGTKPSSSAIPLAVGAIPLAVGVGVKGGQVNNTNNILCNTELVDIMNYINKLSQLKIKETKSYSSRVLFKFIDLKKIGSL